MSLQEINAAFNLESAVRCVEEALVKNPKCVSGLLTQKKVFGILQGPSGGPEMLALLYADDSFSGYWYGHIVQHPQDPTIFVSLIVWSDKFVNGQDVSLFFKHYHYWIKDRLEYYPCSIQNEDDAYRQSESIENAANDLASMIGQFDLEKRRGDEYGLFEDSPSELRIIFIYKIEK